jgi:hypothetical protein
MADYRIYMLDKKGRIFAPATELTCEADEEVIQKARSMVGGPDLERWDGARVVAKIPSED